jgi:hypothetical protein
MPIINITERDMLRGTIIEPAWYRVRVDSVGEKTAKSGTSQNYPLEGTILFNGDTGDTRYAGVPTPSTWLFNEGAMGFASDFIAAITGQPLGKKGGRFELADAVGKELDVFIENGTWEGRTNNKINHKYRQAKVDVVAREG